MMHISCDGCGTDLTDSGLEHFVVHIEAYSKPNPIESSDEEILVDHLEEMSDLLNATDESDEPTPPYTKLRYDLCPRCQKKFLANPIAREVQKLNFSPN